ncbi:hypothetical protein [Bacteriovorax sp. Seq25_V]|uniref:hypothetical protein n=1 Tax=Bacteriovorax sp. Seq25_V TaxID=1201288 RepID=UPI000389DC68|nr:hypothetical protein [Bacteriovorax sp. Seq25_V]EQC47238.1 putative lipoprotein [Bacteriovorax sp. Seq25_V]
MKTLSLFILLSFITSCSSITKLINEQKRLATAVQDKSYDLSLETAKAEVISYFGGWMSVDPSERSKKIREDIDKGFIYNGKYFQKYEPGLFDLFNSMTSKEKDSIKKFFTTNNYHTLQDTKDGFKFIFNGMLFVGNKVAKNKVKLEVLVFNNLERGPYTLDVNWLAFLDKHSSLFSINKGQILIEKSLKHTTRNTPAEIDLFKKLDPKAYEQISKSI